MRKPKIYLDTSVISHLAAPDAPNWQADTRILWKAIQAGDYDVCISPVVIGELYECTEPKLSFLLTQLGLIQYVELQETDEVLELAQKYIDAGVLRQKSFDDCQHIAYACVYNCDMLIAWNHKHLVNVNTISGVKGVNALAGYREMPIYTPTMLILGGIKNDI